MYVTAVVSGSVIPVVRSARYTPAAGDSPSVCVYATPRSSTDPPAPTAEFQSWSNAVTRAHSS